MIIIIMSGGRKQCLKNTDVSNVHTNGYRDWKGNQNPALNANGTIGIYQRRLRRRINAFNKRGFHYKPYKKEDK